jgi:hypothetical protein
MHLQSRSCHAMHLLVQYALLCSVQLGIVAEYGIQPGLQFVTTVNAWPAS